MKQSYIRITVLFYLLAACSPSADVVPSMNEESSVPEVTVPEEVVTEIPEIAEYDVELDYDLGGWPEAPLPTAEAPFSGICYVAFNTEKEPFNEVLVRQAFAYSIDKEYLAQNATCNTCNFRNQRPAITLVPEDFYLLKHGADLYDKWVNHEIPQMEKYSDFYQKWLDDQWYRDLLLEGYVPEEMSVELLTSDENYQIAELVSANWREYLGIDVEFASQNAQDFNAAVTGTDAPAAYVNCNYMDLDSPSDLLIGLVSGYYGDYIRWDAPDDYFRAAFAGYENNEADAYLLAESMLVGEYAVVAPLFYYTVD